MRCNKCNKEFIRPLDLYDGRFACPKCLNDITKLGLDKFRITKDNEEQFQLSEIYFHKSLIEKNKPEYKENAIKLCRMAADSGHPEAIMRLGYYYHFGYIDEQNKNYNMKLAIKYYDFIVFGTNHLLIEDEARINNLESIKSTALLFYKDLASKIPEDFKFDDEQRENIESLKIKKEEINDIFEVETAKTDIVKFVKCHISNVRKPVFSYLRVSKNDIMRLKEEYSLLENLTVGVFSIEDNNISKKAIRLLNQNTFKEFIDAKSEEYYLFVINNIRNYKKDTLLGNKKRLIEFMSKINPLKIYNDAVDRYNSIYECIYYNVRYETLDKCSFYEDDLIYCRYNINEFNGVNKN